MNSYFADDFATKEDGESSPNFDAKDPLNKALSKSFVQAPFLSTSWFNFYPVTCELDAKDPMKKKKCTAGP